MNAAVCDGEVARRSKGLWQERADEPPRPKIGMRSGVGSDWRGEDQILVGVEHYTTMEDINLMHFCATGKVWYRYSFAYTKNDHEVRTPNMVC